MKKRSFLIAFMLCLVELIVVAIDNGESLKENKDSVDVENESDTVRLETPTGTSFYIVEIKTSSVSSDIRIWGEGFVNSKDTLSFLGSDPTVLCVIDDLNRDGFSELYVVTRSRTKNTNENVIAFSSNRDKSFSDIYMPEITKDDLASNPMFKGYSGGNEWSIYNNLLVREFHPVDTKGVKTGKTRLIFYALKKGEAGWIFEAVKSEEK